MKHYLFLLLTLICFQPLMAQRNFAKYMIVGTSFTYQQQQLNSYNVKFDEYVWNVNTGISISKRLFTGIQVLSINTVHLSIKNQYSIYGLFAQYNFLRSRERRFFLEASLNKGDYCTCAEIPYQKDGLNYVGYGLGYDYPIKVIPNLFIDFSFLIYQLLEPENYYFTQYIIGLNYKLN